MLLLGITGAAPAAAPESLPVWEAGPSLVVLTYPDYRGSSHYNVQPLPLPYFVYRGEVLRVGREGFRARLFASDRLDVSLSAGFSLPGNGDTEGSPRAGMPELLSNFEIGPSFDWWLHDGEAEDWDLRLRLPVRAVGASDFQRFKHVGWLTSPHLYVDRRIHRDGWLFQFAAGAGAIFANHSYHAYFYEVSPQFATPTRPVHHTPGGYSGARFSVFAGAKHGRWGVGLGIVDDWLRGATFADSPLVETHNAAVVGLAFTYSWWQSKKRVGGATADATVGD